MTTLVFAFNTSRTTAQFNVSYVTQTDELTVFVRNAQITHIVNIGTPCIRHLQNDIIVIIADGIAVTGILTHKCHLYNFTNRSGIQAQGACARLVKLDYDFWLVIRVRNIYVRSTGNLTNFFCQFQRIGFQQFNIITTQTNLYGTSITTSTTLVGYYVSIYTLYSTYEDTQFVHNFLHGTVTFTGRMQTNFKGALVYRVTRSTNVQRYYFNFRIAQDFILNGLRQFYSLIQACTNGSFKVNCKFAGVIGRLELHTYKRQQAKVEEQRKECTQQNLFGIADNHNHGFIVKLTDKLEASFKFIQEDLQILVTFFFSLFFVSRFKPVSRNHRS